MLCPMSPTWTTIEDLHDINLEGVEVVAADVDFTLFTFGVAHAAAINAVRSAIDRCLGDALQETFDMILEGSRRIDHSTWELRGMYEELLSAMTEKQGVAPAEVKVWSRETQIQVLSDRERLGFTIDDIVRTRDVFWGALASSGGLYPDVETFLQRLESMQIPLVLMTASDSVMRPTDGGFVYDPAYAREYKTRRLDAMGLSYASVVIGDPHDKPSDAFFDLVDQAVKNAGAKNVGRAVAVGDSPKGDVETPAARGYKAYHLNRKTKD